MPSVEEFILMRRLTIGYALVAGLLAFSSLLPFRTKLPAVK